MVGESWEQREAHQGVECDDFDVLRKTDIRTKKRRHKGGRLMKKNLPTLPEVGALPIPAQHG
jgi:hypothetical protein